MKGNKSSKEHYRSKILSVLLSKFENSKASRPGQRSQHRPQFSISKSPLAEEYFDEMDHRKRDAIHEVLQQLQELGVIEYTWEKFQEGRQLKKVYLLVEKVQLAYNLVGLSSKQDKIKGLQEVLDPLREHSWNWVRNWFEEGAQLLQTGKAPVGLDFDDYEASQAVVQALVALPSIDGVMAKRAFSQFLFHDTKKFEQSVEKRLLKVIKKYGQMEFEHDEDYLDYLGLVVHPKISLLAGPIRFAVQGNIVDLGVFPNGIGLTGETIQCLEILDIGCELILLVENLTCYHQMVQECQTNTLVIYTGGFPHRHLQKLLQKISTFLGSVEGRSPDIVHWGDLDYGGIQIFEFIRRNLVPQLLPHLMDVDTYERYKGKGISFSDSYRRKLISLLEDDSFSQWKQVVEAILQGGYRVEQESLLV